MWTEILISVLLSVTDLFLIPQKTPLLRKRPTSVIHVFKSGDYKLINLFKTTKDNTDYSWHSYSIANPEQSPWYSRLVLCAFIYASVEKHAMECYHGNGRGGRVQLLSWRATDYSCQIPHGQIQFIFITAHRGRNRLEAYLLPAHSHCERWPASTISPGLEPETVAKLLEPLPVHSKPPAPRSACNVRCETNKIGMQETEADSVCGAKVWICFYQTMLPVFSMHNVC